MKLINLFFFMFLFSCVESQEDLEDAVETSGGKARSVKSEYERYSYLYSLSREKLSKKVTNPALIEKLKKMIGAGSDIKSLYSLFNIYSISSIEKLKPLEMAKRAARLEMSKNIERTLDESATMDLVLQYIHHGNFQRALFIETNLSGSKSKHILSGLENIKGVLAQREGRVPEAVAHWKKALKIDPQNKSSIINIGYAYLRYGYVDDAMIYLSKISNEWLGKIAEAVVARVKGEQDKINKMCASMLLKEKNNKVILFNCGISELRINKNIPKAKELIGKASTIKGGPKEWDERAYKILEKN